MKLINKTQNAYCHQLDKDYYFIGINKVVDVPEELAKIWLKIDGIEKYVDSKDVEKAAKEVEAKAKEAQKVLAEENKKLKKEVEALKTTKKTTSKKK